jgi:glycosyltransferase involved in cell wall biosynthesis
MSRLVLSVVVPVLDMAESIGACLEALVTQSLPREQFEVIVVDNGSTDGTRDVVQRYPVTLLREPIPGACNARNTGIRAASGPFVAFTDADCVPSRGWLRQLALACASDHVDVVAGPLAVLDPERSLLSRYSATVGQYDPARTLSHPAFPYAVTGNVCIRRAVFDVVGLFNPAFPTFDAAEFFWRLRQQMTLRATIEPRALVFYRTRSTLSAFLRQNYGYGQGTGRLMRRASSTQAPVHAGQTLRSFRTRVADGGRVARSAAGSSRVDAASMLGLHLREAAIAAGMLSAVASDRP